MSVAFMSRRDLDDEMLARVRALGVEPNRRGTMRPKDNDPDAGTNSHGEAVDMIYDELSPPDETGV